ncbi:MAG: hypothetical protein II739_02890 [Clostridia bacterium]|nr:hypothetical protein [Clostridia bacterium]
MDFVEASIWMIFGINACSIGMIAVKCIDYDYFCAAYTFKSFWRDFLTLLVDFAGASVFCSANMLLYSLYRLRWHVTLFFNGRFSIMRSFLPNVLTGVTVAMLLLALVEFFMVGQKRGGRRRTAVFLSAAINDLIVSAAALLSVIIFSLTLKRSGGQISIMLTVSAELALLFACLIFKELGMQWLFGRIKKRIPGYLAMIAVNIFASAVLAILMRFAGNKPAAATIAIVILAAANIAGLVFCILYWISVRKQAPAKAVEDVRDKAEERRDVGCCKSDFQPDCSIIYELVKKEGSEENV